MGPAHLRAEAGSGKEGLVFTVIRVPTSFGRLYHPSLILLYVSYLKHEDLPWRDGLSENIRLGEHPVFGASLHPSELLSATTAEI